MEMRGCFHRCVSLHITLPKKGKKKRDGRGRAAFPLLEFALVMPQRAVQVTPHELIHQHQLRASQTVVLRSSPRLVTSSRNSLVCAVTMQCLSSRTLSGYMLAEWHWAIFAYGKSA